MNAARTVRVAIYTRVSTGGQTTANQLRELRSAAERLGHDVVAEFTDAGISGAKGREEATRSKQAAGWRYPARL